MIFEMLMMRFLIFRILLSCVNVLWCFGIIVFVVIFGDMLVGSGFIFVMSLSIIRSFCLRLVLSFLKGIGARCGVR